MPTKALLVDPSEAMADVLRPIIAAQYHGALRVAQTENQAARMISERDYDLYFIGLADASSVIRTLRALDERYTGNVLLDTHGTPYVFVLAPLGVGYSEENRRTMGELGALEIQPQDEIMHILAAIEQLPLGKLTPGQRSRHIEQRPLHIQKPPFRIEELPQYI